MGKFTWPTCLLLILLLIGSPVSAGEPDLNISWGMFQGNPAHTGYVPISLDPGGFEFKWEQLVGSGLPLNPVAAADGLVFVSLDILYGNGESLFALDAETGKTHWSQNFGSVYIYTVNPPSYADGKVYIQTAREFSTSDWPSYLRAFHADGIEGGEEAFAPCEFLSQWEGYYAPTIHDGTVYMNGGFYGGLYAVDASNGDELGFNDQLPQFDEWTPAVDRKYVYAYVGGSLYAMKHEKNVGDIAFSIEDPDFVSNGMSMDLAPVIGSSDNALVIQGGRLINFDIQKRQIGWVVERGFSGQPSVAKGVIYAIDSGELKAWDEASGNFLWSWQPPGEALSGTMIVTDTHVLAGSDYSTYAIDLETHDNVWTFDAGGHLALGNDSLYIASSTGVLYAITLALPTTSSEPPIAEAGPDQVTQDDVMLDGSGSYDPDGEIMSYEWLLKPKGEMGVDSTLRTFAADELTADGKTPTLSGLEPGFYVVTLTVTDDAGNKAADTMLLAVAGKCEDRPEPNAIFDIRRFRIKQYKYKWWKRTYAEIIGRLDLPDLYVSNGEYVDAKVTIELMLPDGEKVTFSDTSSENIVLQDEVSLKVKNGRRYLRLYY